MKIKQNNRSGFIAGLVILIFIALGMVSWVIYSMGSSKHTRQKQILAEGYKLFNAGKINKAVNKFEKAQVFFSFPLTVYRKVHTFKSNEFINADDINILIISACIEKAYNIFFKLHPAEKWVSIANSALSKLKVSKDQKELNVSLKTAKAVSKLCKLYQRKDFKQTLKGLYKLEQSVATNDKDFFIFEIRLMIACGKQIKSELLLARARELLFFIAYDLKVQDARIKVLWAYLSAK